MATSSFAEVNLDTDRRSLSAWWRIEATLKLKSASQIGSVTSDNSDQTFARDFDGRIVLHGSTLAGALRGALSDSLTGYRKKEAADTALLFGDAKTHQSLIIVFDGVSTEAARPSIRDGVRINVETGLAADGAKFDREIALPGLEIPMRIDLQILEGKDESKLLGLLERALMSLTDGSIRLGARRSRGLGLVEAVGFFARRYDLATTQGWLDYASSPYEGRSPKSVGPFDLPGAAIGAAWSSFADQDKQQDARIALSLDFDLTVHGTLLVRSPGEEADSADVSHLTEEGRAILSGTSLAGALRSRATRILNTLGRSDTTRAVSELFGQTASGQAGSKTEASRVRVTEGVILGNSRYRQTRVKIDRFTGGAIDTALFDEEPSAGGSFSVNVSILNPSDSDIGLGLLLARDLVEGQLPLGGGTSGGRGVVRGAVRVHLPLSPDYILDGENASDGQTIAALQPYVDALIQEIGGMHER